MVAEFLLGPDFVFEGALLITVGDGRQRPGAKTLSVRILNVSKLIGNLKEQLRENTSELTFALTFVTGEEEKEIARLSYNFLQLGSLPKQRT